MKIRPLIICWLFTVLAAGCGEAVTETAAITDAFCHGQSDGVRCDDGSACTEDDVCGNGVCLGRSVPDNVVCDDGLLCTTLDYCEAGTCKGRDVDCGGTETGLCEVAACEPTTGECVAVPASGGPCDDGDACTTGDTCGTLRSCAGAAVDCSAAPTGECQAAVCDPGSGGCALVAGPDGATCGDTDDLCTIGTCKAGGCQKTPKCATAGGSCRIGICEPETGECTSVPKTDALDCEDGDPCTAGEACAAGECTGGEVVPDGTLCQDGDPCHTVGLCTAGECDAPDKDCTVLDTACAQGTCDSGTGGCVAEDRDDGLACDDGQSCTAGETCQGGLCLAPNSACSCTGKADATPCDDGDACTAGDACSAGVCSGALKDCSAKDGPCTLGGCAEGSCVAFAAVDGTPCTDSNACTSADVCIAGGCSGEPTACEAGPCLLATCNKATGACGVQPAFDGSVCDDDDACTAEERCDGGDCVAGTELCAACAGKSAGELCDDGSACTSEDVCANEDTALVCRGAVITCPQDGLDVCEIAACVPATGACVNEAAPVLAPCDDQNPCTVDDRCAAGGCAGDEVDTCGVSIDACGTALAVATAERTTLAWLEPEGVTELTVSLSAGQALEARTEAHCGVAVDTLLELVDPSGQVIAKADDSPAGAFAALAELLVDASGVYTLRVQGAFLTERASIFVVARTEAEVSCTGNADCACSDKACKPAGGGGACAWADTSLAVPGDLTEAAVITVGQTIRGRLQGGADTEVRRLTLAKGEAVTLVTRSLCGSALDTTVTLRAPEGDVIGQADAGGAGQFGVLEAAIAQVAGDYRVEVSSPSAASGAYALDIRSGLCTKTSECLCAERACSGSPGSPGVCAPKLDVGEPAGDVLPSLATGNRIHSTLASFEDEDRYTVTLAAGTYAVRIRGFCGAATTATATVLTGGGETVLAAGAPDVVGFQVQEPGIYQISASGGVGDYTLLVEVSP